MPGSLKVAPWRGIAGCRRGVAAVEFALAATPMLLVVFGLIASNVLFFTLSVMQSRALLAAQLVGVGTTTSNANGAFTLATTGASNVTCSSSLATTTVEYQACNGLPSWATFSITSQESCTSGTVPQTIAVTISANSSAAALADIFNLFAGQTLSATATAGMYNAVNASTCPTS